MINFYRFYITDENSLPLIVNVYCVSLQSVITSLETILVKFYVQRCFGSPPWSATLPWWWGFAPMTQKISKIWKWGANWELTKPVRADCYTLPVLLCWFRLHSRLRLYSRLFTSLQPSVYGFTAVYGFIAATCNLLVTFGDAHWAELIRPQCWAGVRACPPQR